MALTITTLTPSTGLTGGREFVLITGTDFNINFVGGVAQMEVYFGTEKATRVRVRSTTQLDCLTPISDPGQVGVKVKDLQAVTEFTLPNAFTFARPVLGGGTRQSTLWHVIDTVIRELRRQVLEEVISSVETDFDELPDGTRFTKLAKVPALILDGPEVRGSTGPHHRCGEEFVQTAPDQFSKAYPQDYVDLVFTLTGVDDHKVRLFNMKQSVIEFFRKNEILKVLKDPLTPSSGYFEIDMRPPHPQDWRTDMRGNKSNLKFFVGEFTLFGVPVGNEKVFDESKGITTFNVQSLQKS